MDQERLVDGETEEVSSLAWRLLLPETQRAPVSPVCSCGWFPALADRDLVFQDPRVLVLGLSPQGYFLPEVAGAGVDALDAFFSLAILLLRCSDSSAELDK